MSSPLGVWLQQQGMSQEAFASLIGATQGQVSRYARGQRRPGVEAALAIEKATGGAIPVAAWRRPGRRRSTAPRKTA